MASQTSMDEALQIMARASGLDGGLVRAIAEALDKAFREGQESVEVYRRIAAAREQITGDR